MFTRHVSERPEPEPEPEPEPAHRPTRDAKVFQPSTLASRRAARLDRDEAPRLVSLGTQKVEVEGMGPRDRWGRRTGGGTLEVEFWADVDRRSRIYVRTQNDPLTLVPVVTRTHEAETVTPAGTMPRRPSRPVMSEPADADRARPAIERPAW